MKTNEELQKNVVEAINWEPLLQAAEIGVMANKGAITLTGSVNTYAKKAEAEQAAKNVAGVRTVLEDIKVICNVNDKRTDAQITTAIENILMWYWDIPTEKISISVKNSWVFLNGELEWNYQKEATQKALNNLIGITGITNNIVIINASKDIIKKKEIEFAIASNSTIGYKNIGVYVFDNVVTLRGHVNSLLQKSEAGRIAENTYGIKHLINDLYVDFDDE